MAARSDAPPSAFDEDQRAELKALIAEAVASGTPPPAAEPAGKSEGPTVTDDEWAKMSDRQRQGFVDSRVKHVLGELARLDADQRRDAKLAELEVGNKAPEPEKPPSVWTRLQGFLWGEPDAG